MAGWAITTGDSVTSAETTNSAIKIKYNEGGLYVGTSYFSRDSHSHNYYTFTTDNPFGEGFITIYDVVRFLEKHKGKGGGGSGS